MSSNTAGFRGELSFAKTDNYLDSLLVIGHGGSTNIVCPLGEGDATLFAHAAEVLAKAESVQTRAAGHAAGLLPLTATGSDETTLHKLDWLNISERKRNAEPRSCHELYLAIDDGEPVVTFEHGKFGYRSERHGKWSTAFSRVAQVMAGECSWHQFGDPESQTTMLGKGQFYWVDQRNQKMVPIDNFVFRAADTFEVRLAGVGHRCALSVDRVGDEGASEWYADYAEGMLRMADVLDGAVDLAQFGEGPDPDLYLNAKGKRQPEEGVIPLATQGQFFVEAIDQTKTAWPAPVLVYKTAEGAQATLDVSETLWRVRVGDEIWQSKTRCFPRNCATNALRTLAQVLRGTILFKDF